MKTRSGSGSIKPVKKKETSILEGLKNCHDCNASPGKPHMVGCDTERCSVCGGQMLMCGHKKHDPLFARWTGLWPGAAEAAILGIDLSTFHREGYNKIFFVKPKE